MVLVPLCFWLEVLTHCKDRGQRLERLRVGAGCIICNPYRDDIEWKASGRMQYAPTGLDCGMGKK